MLETNTIRGATQLDLRSTFSYTIIYAAVITDAEAVSPYLAEAFRNRPQKSIQQFCSYRVPTAGDSLKCLRKAYSSFSMVCFIGKYLNTECFICQQEIYVIKWLANR